MVYPLSTGGKTPYVLAPQEGASTGALAEMYTAHDKLNRVHLDLRADFGAAGDGSTDDTARFVSAVAALAENAGGTLFLPPGVYRTETLLIEDLVDFQIVSPFATVIGIDEDQAVLQMNDCSRFLVQGLLLHQDAATDRNSVNFGIRIEGCVDFGLLNNRVRDVEAGGIIAYECSQGVISGNVIRDTMADGIHLTRGCRRITIQANSVDGAGDDAIAVIGYQAHGTYDEAVCKDIAIIGNHTQQNRSRGIVVAGAEGVVVSANTVREPKYAGVYVSYDSNYDTYGNSDVTVQGNVIFDANTFDSPSIDYAGIDVRTGATGFPVQNINILDNTVRGSRWRLLNVGAPTGTDLVGVTVRGNRLYGYDDASSEGVVVQNVQNFWMVDNYVKEARGTGIYVEDDVTGVCRVKDNIVENANAGNLATQDGFTIKPDGSWTEGNQVIDGNGNLDQGLRVTGTGITYFNNDDGGAGITITDPTNGRLIRTRKEVQSDAAPVGGTWNPGDVSTNRSPASSDPPAWMYVEGGTWEAYPDLIP